MSITNWSASAIACGIALTFLAVADAAAQTDTTRRPGAVSEQRIPLRKDQGLTRRTSPGEVMLSVERARIDSLERLASAYQQRLDSVSAAFTARSEATDRSIAMLQDSLRAVRAELSTSRSETSALITALRDTLQQVNQRFLRFRNGSLFGNSGFYVGVGSGANFTTGTFENIGYQTGLNVTIPVGWHKRGNVIGVRGELGIQTFDGRNSGGFSNPDPKLFSIVGLVTVNLPMNAARTNTFYLMGGGGAYMFNDITAGSTLGDRLGAPASGSSTTSETKWGFQGGAGLEVRVLGATSLFAQTGITSVSVDEPRVSTLDDGRTLRWIPLILGIQLR